MLWITADTSARTSLLLPSEKAVLLSDRCPRRPEVTASLGSVHNHSGLWGHSTQQKPVPGGGWLANAIRPSLLSPKERGEGLEATGQWQSRGQPHTFGGHCQVARPGAAATLNALREPQHLLFVAPEGAHLKYRVEGGKGQGH